MDSEGHLGFPDTFFTALWGSLSVLRDGGGHGTPLSSSTRRAGPCNACPAAQHACKSYCEQWHGISSSGPPSKAEGSGTGRIHSSTVGRMGKAQIKSRHFHMSPQRRIEGAHFSLEDEISGLRNKLVQLSSGSTADPWQHYDPWSGPAKHETGARANKARASELNGIDLLSMTSV